MEGSIFQNVHPEERLNHIISSCDKIEDFTFEKAFTNQDIEGFCDRLSQIMISLKSLEAELSRVKKEYNEKSKLLKVEVSELLNNIKFRSKMVKDKVYIFLDHEKNQVGYYSADGTLVHKRSLRIDEFQKSIMEDMRNSERPYSNEMTRESVIQEYDEYSEVSESEANSFR